MTNILIKSITEKYGGISAKLKKGDRVPGPDGKLVEITGGQFMGEHGVSNFWYWKRVSKNGKLKKKEYHGYGWL